MSLFLATLCTALICCGAGALLLWNGPAVGATARVFPRSRRAALLCFGAGAIWFLYHVTQLGEADFGEYKWIIFAVFATVALLAYRLAPDFLAVRGAAILVLLAAHPLLYAGFLGDESWTVLRLKNAALYVAIALAIYLGGVPYRLRDAFQWLFARPSRPRLLGSLFAAYGAVLLIAALQL